MTRQEEQLALCRELAEVPRRLAMVRRCHREVVSADCTAAASTGSFDKGSRQTVPDPACRLAVEPLSADRLWARPFERTRRM